VILVGCKFSLRISEQWAGEYSGDGIGRVFGDIAGEYSRRNPHFLPEIFVRFNEQILLYDSSPNIRSVLTNDVYYKKIICTGHMSSLSPNELVADCDGCPYNGSGRAKEASSPSGVV